MKDRVKGLKGIIPVVLISLIISAVGVVQADESVPAYYEMFVKQICTPDMQYKLKLPKVATLKIPEGALSEETEISMEFQFYAHYADPELVVIFGPHGTQFNVPVTLKIKTKMLEFNPGDTIGIFYYDEDDDIWEFIDSFDVVEGQNSYRIDLDHFSIYAFSKIRNGGN